jgi:thiol-disulfide isomerase/thioredoxin
MRSGLLLSGSAPWSWSAQPRSGQAWARPGTLAALLLTLGFASTAAAVGVGEPAPAFELPGLREQDGTALHRLSDFRGQVVYVDFWASWCGPCVISAPLLDDLRRRLVAEGARFEILAVDVDEDPEKGIDFLLDQPVSYLALRDPAGTVPGLYALRGMPTGYLLDQQGVVRLVHEGFKPADIGRIESEIRQLLAN